MALGKRKGSSQGNLFISSDELCSSSNAFYDTLDRLLCQRGFDAFVEQTCRKFYADGIGRPGVPPGVYFRMLLVGYLEGLGSERGIAWRCNDSLAIRKFLGYDLTERTPEHSTLSKTRKRLSVEAHLAVFGWVLALLKASGLLRGKTLGIDSTTLEANAAMRSIVLRENGASYTTFLASLAKESGIETPTRADLAKLDKHRKNKGSNKDWRHPGASDARITKLKDGRTHLAHKYEHAVDMETGALVGVTVQTMEGGDTASLEATLDAATEQLDALDLTAQDVVADKGYHSNKVMVSLEAREVRSYISEPKRGRRNWKKNKAAQKPTYANRRRIRGNRGKFLLRQRGEKVERAFAHLLETGGLRRVHVRDNLEILKRMILQGAAYNLGLLMRACCGVGKPRVLQGNRSVQLALAGA